jgi:CHAT domain-containing protein
VLVRYAGRKVGTFEGLKAALLEHAKDKAGGLELVCWRDGEHLTVRVAPGPLGVALGQRPAPEAVRARRALGQALARSRGAGLKRLPGTRREVQAIARLFAGSTLLLGPAASEQRLDALASAGQLKKHRYLHLATHGFADSSQPLRSYLALTDRDLPGALERALANQPVYTGRLTAARALEAWELDADLVVLSACQTGLGEYARGEGYVGFAQAFLLAGARSLVLSLWSVDDEATALLMVRFYQNLLGKRDDKKTPMPRAEALEEAKSWLRNLSATEVKTEVEKLPRGKAAKPVPLRKEAKPFAHPYFWAAFVLVGDPR